MDVPRLGKLYTDIELADVDNRLNIAKATFLRDDVELLTRKAGERAMAFRYAVYIDRLFPEWDVDCEYNLDGDKTKRLKRSSVVGDVRTPDIVVHHRGYERNLIIFEVKRSKNKANDKLKLETWQRAYKYRYTVALRFIYGVNDIRIALSEYDNQGRKIHSIGRDDVGGGGAYMVPQ